MLSTRRSSRAPPPTPRTHAAGNVLRAAGMTSPASVDAAAATGSPDSRKRVLDEMAQKAAKANKVLEKFFARA